MASKKKPAKDKIKSKAKAVKVKVKGKIKGSVAIMAAILGLVLFEGCMTPGQASRSTAATVGDVTIENRIEEIKSKPGPYAAKADQPAATPLIQIVSKITFGDMALASADSAGSTESQTQTPTFDISPKTDVRYNDALAAASTTSKGILETLTATGMNKVLALMDSGGSGQVTVEKKDGGQAVVTCEGGQCTTCKDCTP